RSSETGYSDRSKQCHALPIAATDRGILLEVVDRLRSKHLRMPDVDGNENRSKILVERNVELLAECFVHEPSEHDSPRFIREVLVDVGVSFQFEELELAPITADHAFGFDVLAHVIEELHDVRVSRDFDIGLSGKMPDGRQSLDVVTDVSRTSAGLVVPDDAERTSLSAHGWQRTLGAFRQPQRKTSQLGGNVIAHPVRRSAQAMFDQLADFVIEPSGEGKLCHLENRLVGPRLNVSVLNIAHQRRLHLCADLTDCS